MIGDFQKFVVVVVIVKGFLCEKQFTSPGFPRFEPQQSCQAGSSGSENRGIYRLHQFSKVGRWPFD